MLNYIKEKNQIKILSNAEFDIEQILNCGQIFTFEKKDDCYYVFSKDKMVKVFDDGKNIILETDSVDYFENFFDLKTDYSLIKADIIKKNPNLKKAINFGSNLRILKQDIFETIISFIISANNNISRITKSMKYIRENLGENKGEYFSFPKIEKLSKQDESFFIKANLGYRAKQMVKALAQIEKIDFEKLKILDTKLLKNELIQLSGVGPKVADCILLFGFSRFDVFPVDTWISKVYHDLFNTKQTNRNLMREDLLNKFGNLSGYVQQYLFFYKRSSKEKI